jgi:hypothetical protein
MKRLGILMITVVTLWSCSTEELDTTQVVLPSWLVGEYMGVHTQSPLSVNNSTIQFEVNQQVYQFSMNPNVQIEQTELSITFFFGSEVLTFNKTTQDTEVHLQFNDLYLGWFRKRDIK